MKTTNITKALRNSNFPEAKVLTRHDNGKARTRQQGWELHKYENYVVVANSAIDFYLDQTASQEFAVALTELMASNGFQVQVITAQRQNTLGTKVTTWIKELRIVEEAK